MSRYRKTMADALKEVYKGKNNKFVVYYVKKGNPDSMISSQIFDNESKAKDFENKMKEQGHKIKQHTNEAEDHEISMARGELEAIADKATRLASMLQGKSDEGNPLEAWVQSKITKAKDYINSVSDYMTYNPDMKQNEELEETLDEKTYGWTLVSKAKDLAKKFANNYTKAVDEIEKLQKGLSKNSAVEKELMKYNEDTQRPSPANPNPKELDEATSHTVRYTDPKNKKRFAVPFKTHSAAEKKMAQLKKDGVTDIKITMDTLKPGMSFKEEYLFEKTYDEKDIDKFHKALDKIVHKHFGHSSDEKKEKEQMKKEELDESSKIMNYLKTTYASIKDINPEQAKTLRRFLEKLPKSHLRDLVKNNIKFVTPIARNILGEETIEEGIKPYVSGSGGKYHVLDKDGKTVYTSTDINVANTYLKKNYDKLKEEIEKEYFSQPRTLGKSGYGTAHPLHPSNKQSMYDKIKKMLQKKKNESNEDIEEGKISDIFKANKEGESSNEIAKRLKMSVSKVKDILGEQQEGQPTTDNSQNIIAAKDKEIEALKNQMALMKQKIENEKNRAVKPEPNPETGEVPLTIGIAHKIIRDNQKKEAEEKKQKETRNKLDQMARDGTKLESFIRKFLNDLTESAASDKAKAMGLDYMSFGRYGKDGKVTHKSVGGTLKALSKSDQEKEKEKKPAKPKTKTTGNIKNPDDSNTTSGSVKKEILQKIKDEDLTDPDMLWQSEEELNALAQDLKGTGDNETASIIYDALDSVEGGEIDKDANSKIKDMMDALQGKPNVSKEQNKKLFDMTKLYNDIEYDKVDLRDFAKDTLNIVDQMAKVVDVSQQDPVDMGPQLRSDAIENISFAAVDIIDKLEELEDDVFSDNNLDVDIKDEIVGELNYIADESADHDGYTKVGKIVSAIESIKFNMKKLQKKSKVQKESFEKQVKEETKAQRAKRFKDMERYYDAVRKKELKGPNKALAKKMLKTEEMRLRVEAIAGLKKKADKSGMPYNILKQVYDRGMAAWKSGHRPGASQQQWAFARVNSFITKSSGTWGGADKDLAAKVKGSK